MFRELSGLLAIPGRLLMLLGSSMFRCHAQVKYSSNHNLLRTIGFITILAAVGS